MKRKTQHLAQKKNGTVFPSPPRHGAIMKKKIKQTLGLVASSFPFLFLCLSFTFSKNNNEEYKE